MIMQKLNAYYRRLRKEGMNIPEFGFSNEKISYAIVLNQKGELLKIRSLKVQQGKKLTPRVMNVPKFGGRSSGIKPYFLWDNTGYVLGVDSKGKPERSREMFEAFREQITSEDSDSVLIKAVQNFLNNWSPEKAETLENWDEIIDTNLVFEIDINGTPEFIHDSDEAVKIWQSKLMQNTDSAEGTCLITGESGPIASTHPMIKGVFGAQTAGAAITSFNKDAFCSYGKKQNLNSPVSEVAAFNYTTALNHLLRQGSDQKVQLGDTAVLFWTEKKTRVETLFSKLINPPKDDGYDEDLALFLKHVSEGKLPDEYEPEVPFYILGLAPNAARLSIRFWHMSTVSEMANHLKTHYDQMQLVKSREEDSDHPTPFRILLETAVLHKVENIPPLLGGALMRSIMTGLRYPQLLFTTLITRIRADQTINYTRASIIKAILIRNHNLEVSVSLDKNNTNTAYRLGRLFAVLEKSQRDALGKINATIKDRYFGAASSTPKTVFPILLKLTQHHISKAEFGHLNDKMIEEICGGVNEFPAHMSLEEQGLFNLGYYHQRQNFYTKKETETVNA